MKKITPIPTITVMYVALIINTSCETVVGFSNIKMRTAETTEQKDKALAPVNTGKEYINAINIKAVRSFDRAFKDAENVSWRTTDDGEFVAQFESDSIQTFVSYAINGSWEFTLREYSEKYMSHDLRTLIKSTYYDYSIKKITEMEQPNENNIIYTVIIKSGDNIKILRIYDWEMEVIGDYTKP